MAVGGNCSHYLGRKSRIEVHRFTHEGKKLGGKIEIAYCSSEIVKCHNFFLVLISLRTL